MLDVPEILSRASLMHRNSMAVHRASVSERGSSASAGGDLAEWEDERLLSELKYHYHMSLKAGIWHLQHQGTLGKLATDILVDALNHKLDDKASDWIKWTELASKSADTPSETLRSCRGAPVVGSLVVAPYLDAKTQMKAEWPRLPARHHHLDWSTCGRNEKHQPAARGDARQRGGRARDAHPPAGGCGGPPSVNTRQAARLMLNKTREQVHHLEEAGMLPELQAKAMVAQVETQMRKLTLASMNVGLRARAARVSWIAELSDESLRTSSRCRREAVRDGLVPRQAGRPRLRRLQRLPRRAASWRSCRSTSRASPPSSPGAARATSSASVPHRSPRGASARAVTHVICFVLPYAAMRKGMEAHPELARRMWHHVGKNLAQKLLGDLEEESLGERTSTAEELVAQAEAWVPNVHAVALLDGSNSMMLERRVLLLAGTCLEYRESEQPPSVLELEGLLAAVKERRRRSSPSSSRCSTSSGSRTTAAPTARRRPSLRALLRRARRAQRRGGDRRSRARDRRARRRRRRRGNGGAGASIEESMAASDATKRKMSGQRDQGHVPPPRRRQRHLRPVQQDGRLRPVGEGGPGDDPPTAWVMRTLHQTSWIVHIAPCFIDVPTGGLQARMLKCVTPCRLVAEPASRNADGSPHSPVAMAMRAGQVQNKRIAAAADARAARPAAPHRDVAPSEARRAPLHAG